MTDAASGKSLAGLLVRALDRDLLRDDPLGGAHPDADGRFEIVFSEVQFRDFPGTLGPLPPPETCLPRVCTIS